MTIHPMRLFDVLALTWISLCTFQACSSTFVLLHIVQANEIDTSTTNTAVSITADGNTIVNPNPLSTSTSITSFSKSKQYYRRASPPLPIEGTINWVRLKSRGSSMFTPRHSHATCIFPCPYVDEEENEDNKEENDDDDDDNNNNEHNSNNDSSENSNQKKTKRRKCIWLTGGRTEPYRTFDLQMDVSTADIWYSADGATWNKVTQIHGDFLPGIGNHDAKIGGEVAPWYSRYGHSLDTLTIMSKDDSESGENEEQIMVLMGGYQPIASNDVWISHNGTSWYFVGHAPWPERAYHATTVFGNKLYIMGGTPLTNDVWSGEFIKDTSGSGTGSSHTRGGYRVRWKMEVADGTSAEHWAPRCAMCAVTQVRRVMIPITTSSTEDVEVDENTEDENVGDDDNYLKLHEEKKYIEKEYMFLIGGFAGWPREDPKWDGERTRNDVWRTEDGINWERLMPPYGKNTMAFVGRGWHACKVWHHPTDRSRGVRQSFQDKEDGDEGYKPPKIFLSGGGYMGTKGNNAVERLEGYVDMYWSYDGSVWKRVNYEEGYPKKNLYSTNEWTTTWIGDGIGSDKDGYVHLGKWGHTIESLEIEEDLNADGSIHEIVPVEVCPSRSGPDNDCNEFDVDETNVPSMFTIGGDTTDGGPITNDVFMSRPGVLCEVNGITCSGVGSCGPSTIGCVCDSPINFGEYCNHVDEDFVSASPQWHGAAPMWVYLAISFILACWICVDSF